MLIFGYFQFKPLYLYLLTLSVFWIQRRQIIGLTLRLKKKLWHVLPNFFPEVSINLYSSRKSWSVPNVPRPLRTLDIFLVLLIIRWQLVTCYSLHFYGSYGVPNLLVHRLYFLFCKSPADGHLSWCFSYWSGYSIETI